MLYADAENVWTPNRVRTIERRMEAMRSIRLAAQAKANANQNTLVKPFDSPDHRFTHTPGEYTRGILFSDGSIHTWDGFLEHYEYMRDNGFRMNVQACRCDKDGQDGGWGFYVADEVERDFGEVLRPYFVPEELQDELERTILAAEETGLPTAERVDRSYDDDDEDYGDWEDDLPGLEPSPEPVTLHERVERAREVAEEIIDRQEIILKQIRESISYCDGCDGDGRYPLRNGTYGKCFRCGGKGEQNHRDRRRNQAYDARRKQNA